LAGKIMDGSGFGVIGDLLLGLVGGLIGGAIFGSPSGMNRRNRGRHHRSGHPGLDLTHDKTRLTPRLSAHKPAPLPLTFEQDEVPHLFLLLGAGVTLPKEV